MVRLSWVWTCKRLSYIFKVSRVSFLEEQDKVLRSYFAQKGEGGREFKEGESLTTKVGSMSSGTCTCEEGTEGKGAKPRCMIKGRARDEWGRVF